MAERDKPWIFRTYAGHSTAAESNRLYRLNLEKGQTGLSVAFDLPTQTGYDCGHPLARGETGKTGVTISHIGDMRALFDGLPLAQMNTSMTINATAAWLLALYVAVADEQAIPRASLSGTTQNDIIKEYLSRGAYVFPPGPSLKLTADVIAFCVAEMPRWNPVNICSYHLQEAGATPEQEMGFALAAAIAVLDAVRQTGAADMVEVVGRMSFFVNAGIRFISEMCKMRAFTALWDEITLERYGVADPVKRRFRYGVQVNSLGLTEQQPENNIHRILLEMLGVTLSKTARARAVQLPCWNEALGLPRPWDQQWSLRMQQILALETDLLEYGDIFENSIIIEKKVSSLKMATRAVLDQVAAQGGTLSAIDSGFMKQSLVESNTARLKAIETGAATLVGVNAFTSTEPSPLTAGAGLDVFAVPEHVEQEQIARLKAWRRARDGTAVRQALADLDAAARGGANIMEPSIACARAGVTTGEWGEALRQVYGPYRARTGVMPGGGGDDADAGLAEVREAVALLAVKLGMAPRLLVGKPGLDGHSNGAEQIAVRAAAAGFTVTYDGIRFTPAELVASAAAHEVHIIGLSVLSGSHVPLLRDVMHGLRAAGLGHVPVVAGGIIPTTDIDILKQLGIAAVYTPKDYQLNRIMLDLVRLAGR